MHIYILYIYLFLNRASLFNPSPSDLYVILTFSAWRPLKIMVISSMEKVTPSIQMSVNIKSIYIRRGCTFQFGNFGLGGDFIRGVWNERMPWSSCNGSFYLAQINCRKNHLHLTFPHAVYWISFIVVVMKIFHGICK